MQIFAAGFEFQLVPKEGSKENQLGAYGVSVEGSSAQFPLFPLMPPLNTFRSSWGGHKGRPNPDLICNPSCGSLGPPPGSRAMLTCP